MVTSTSKNRTTLNLSSLLAIFSTLFLVPTGCIATSILNPLSCFAASTQRSCHSIYQFKPDSCCYNGAIEQGGKESGLILATQFWDARPSVGPSDSTTIHGLWPDYCDGTYPAFCSNVTGIPEYSGEEIQSIIAEADPELLDYMNTYYKDYNGNDPSFWNHEQAKHGTCFSTLRGECQHSLKYRHLSQNDQAMVGYFSEIVKQFKSLPTYKWLKEAEIVPSDSKNYTLAEIEGALAKKHGGVPFIGCQGTKLDEFWYYFNTYGPVINGKYVPVDSTTKSSCPDQGIQYLPK